MDLQLKFDIFISYRRDGGEVLGRLLFELMKDKYNIFFDHESLSSGRFDQKLLDIIEGCNDFIVIFSKNCFDRCSNDGDWFMREINWAIENKKNIIPLIDKDFVLPTEEELSNYPERIRELINYHGYELNVAHIDSVVDKICHGLKTEPRERHSSFDSISGWVEFSRCLGDPHYSGMLPDELKMSIVNNSISAFLDEYSAPILRNTLDRLSRSSFNVRTYYRYEIDIREGFDFRFCDIDSDKYYELFESLAYTKVFRTELPPKQFWISFATGLTELDDELHADNFFFSENLTISSEDMQKLCALDEDERMEFYKSVMRVRVNINGNVLTPERLVMSENGIFALYSLGDEESSNTLDVKIRFRVPQKYGNNFFFACISEPTYSPFVRVSYDEDAFDIEMIPFLTRSLTAKDTKIFDGVRELSVNKEWIMPVSGAIFLINKK
jgi:hypothetical protein